MKFKNEIFGVIIKRLTQRYAVTKNVKAAHHGLRGSLPVGGGEMSEQSSKVRYAIIAIAVFSIAEFSRYLLFRLEFYRQFWSPLPDPVRWLEQPFRWSVLCLLGLFLAHRYGPLRAIRAVGLLGRIRVALLFALAATLPMLLGFALTGSFNSELSVVDALFLAGVWPLAEEILFRGYFFRQLHRYAAWGFWTAALTTGIVFGAVHLLNASVQRLPLSGEIGVVAIIGVGGVFYAWLFVRWEDNLWVPFGMHMFMNLWWEVFAVDETALGTWFANILRLLTVVLAIVLTVYGKRIWKSLSKDKD